MGLEWKQGERDIEEGFVEQDPGFILLCISEGQKGQRHEGKCWVVFGSRHFWVNWVINVRMV